MYFCKLALDTDHIDLTISKSFPLITIGNPKLLLQQIVNKIIRYASIPEIYFGFQMKFSEHLCWVIICNAVVKVSKGLSFISMLKVNFYQAQKHKVIMGNLS